MAKKFDKMALLWHKITSEPEENREKSASVIYNITKLGVEWTEGYFLPIVAPMIAAVTETEFAIYPMTAARLKQMVKTSFIILLDAVARQKNS